MPAPTSRRSSCLGLALFSVLATTGCGRDQAAGAATETELVIFAAASLRGAFGELGKRFEREHPGVALTYNFAGTQELRTQVEHGAGADVFASADRRHTADLEQAKRVESPR
ncbi:MAG TPA: extracellular solute-binding protein, partial [Polyangiaceae bacterium]